MFAIVRNVLDTYLREKRVITLSDFTSDISQYTASKEAVFITLYYEGRVIASSGRIVCKKENTLYECVDNTLMCLKDSRFGVEIQDLATLGKIHIRTDRFSAGDRRVLRDVTEIDTKNEGIMFLSQNLGKFAVILPNMIHIDTSPAAYFDLVCKKAQIDSSKLTPSDYVLYGFRTKSETDFES
ncbi:MAG: hypothetical protein HHAS10_05590 [Candidatus Altimarinota bacterium]